MGVLGGFGVIPYLYIGLERGLGVLGGVMGRSHSSI